MESKFNYKNFSVVIPIYNEEEILEESTNAIFSICKSMEIDFEIIFSENGSTDNTCLLYTSPSPRDVEESRMPSSA